MTTNQTFISFYKQAAPLGQGIQHLLPYKLLYNIICPGWGYLFVATNAHY